MDRSRRYGMAVVTAVFISIGMLLLGQSGAATVADDSEAETGVVAGSAGPDDSGGASSNAGTGFGQAGSGSGSLNLPRIPWEGGPAYWAKFPKAAAAGWTNPDFFPISTWFPRPEDAATLRNLGVNIGMGIIHDPSDTSYNPRILKVTDPDRDPATEDGIFAMVSKEYENGTEWTPDEIGDDNRTVAWFITDECEMGYSGCGDGTWTQYQELDTQISRTDSVRARHDGRFVHSNFGNGVARTFWSPNTMDEHVKLMDSSSSDKYAYTSVEVGGPGGVVPGSRNWPKGADAMTSAAYGWIQDQVQLLQQAEKSPGDPTPAEPESRRPFWVTVETARPLLEEAGARAISPDQTEGAVWEAIIHEARGVNYFPQNNDDCGGYYSVLEVDNRTPSCLEQLQARQDKFRSVNAAIHLLAPVLNTQSYVWDFSNDGDTANNADTMLKTYDGHAYIFAGIGLNYTGTDTNDCETINLETVCQKLGSNQPTGAKNFILPPGVSGTSVEVVGENRTIPISNGAFTDNFASEYTHHIYKVAL